MAAIRSSIRHYRLFSTTSSTTISATNTKLPNPETPNNASDSNTTTSPILSHFTTIRRLAKSRKFSDIETLIKSQKKDPEITEEEFISRSIRSYGVAGMTDNALTLFNQMEDLGTPKTTLSFNALLSAYTTCGKNSEVPKLFDEIPKKYGFSPDRVSYSILIKSLCGLGLPDSAISVLKEMVEKNIEVTNMNYTQILDAWYKKGNDTKAEKIWKEMIEKGFSPDVATYNARIMHGAHKGKTKEVLGLMDEMIAQGLKPDTTSYNYVYSCYCKDKMMEQAEKVYQDLEKKGCSPNSATFRLRITSLCENGDFGKAYEVFQDSMQRNRVPSVRILKVLVAGLVKSSKIEEAKEVIKSVKKKFPDNTYTLWKKIEEELGLNEGEVSPTQEASVASA